MMYHFDYLTLLLSGALDAQARVADLVYGISPKEPIVGGFLVGRFKNRLKERGVPKLYEIVSSNDFDKLRTLLSQVRNTIHESSLLIFGHELPMEIDVSLTRPPESSMILIPPKRVEKIWEAAQFYGDPSGWGIVRAESVAWLEPYSYAIRLTGELMKVIGEIAAATEVERMLSGTHHLLWADAPWDKPPWDPETGARLRLLG